MPLLYPRRLFVGLVADPPLQRALRRHLDAWQWPQDEFGRRVGRFTSFGCFHLSLVGLGDAVSTAHEHLARKALRRVHARPFDLLLEQPVQWGGTSVLLPRPHAALAALHDAVTRALGMPTKYGPHLTLARHAAGAVPPARCEPLAWQVREFVLIWSQVALHKPTRHETLEAYPLDPYAPAVASAPPWDQLGLFG